MGHQGKKLMGKMQIPAKQVMLWQEDTSPKVFGSNVGAGNIFFCIFLRIATFYKRELYNVVN